MRFRLEISYDGTAYSGWQRQPNATTVQEKVEDALSTLLRVPIEVVGCGRTDAGVHAQQFFLHFDAGSIAVEEPVFRLNQMLPNDIAVLGLEEVDAHFHARFDATSRTYEYHVDLRKDPFGVHRRLLLWQRPDIELLNHCCSILLEYEDFAAFSRTGSDNKTTLCKVMEAHWSQQGEKIVFRIKADRFLRNMVRALVGTMLEVGLGKRDLNDWRNTIESKDRKRAGKSAAAWGLYLTEVNY